MRIINYDDDDMKLAEKLLAGLKPQDLKDIASIFDDI